MRNIKHLIPIKHISNNNDFEAKNLNILLIDDVRNYSFNEIIEMNIQKFYFNESMYL